MTSVYFKHLTRYKLIFTSSHFSPCAQIVITHYVAIYVGYHDLHIKNFPICDLSFSIHDLS